MGVNLLTCSPLNSHAASAWYYLTDANYNVVMLVTDSGYGVERIFYTAYGEPEVFPFGDVDGDYRVVDPTDKNAMIAIKDGQAPYNILADLNLDGAVTQADLNAFSAYSGALGGRNVLTASNGSATTGNDIGYAGYTWNDERAQWHVRHREYDPKLGRWLQRDVIVYIDSMNFYEYGKSDPASRIDPLGLSAGYANPLVAIEAAICKIGYDVATSELIRRLCLVFPAALIAIALDLPEKCVNCAERLRRNFEPQPVSEPPPATSPVRTPQPSSPRFRPGHDPTRHIPDPTFDPLLPLIPLYFYYFPPWGTSPDCDPYPKPNPGRPLDDDPTQPQSPRPRPDEDEGSCKWHYNLCLHTSLQGQGYGNRCWDCYMRCTGTGSWPSSLGAGMTCQYWRFPSVDP